MWCHWDIKVSRAAAVFIAITISCRCVHCFSFKHRSAQMSIPTFALKYKYREILMIWTQANCAGINRVCLRQNCEHTRGRVVFLFCRTDHMICSAQCRAERGVDLLQIWNTKFRGEILGNFSTVLRPQGTLIPLQQEWRVRSVELRGPRVRF